MEQIDSEVCHNRLVLCVVWGGVRSGYSTMMSILSRIGLWTPICFFFTRWRHQTEKFSALLALCAGNSPVSGEFPSQRPVTRIFYVFFDLCLNKRLSKQSRGWWFETPFYSSWRHCNYTHNPPRIMWNSSWSMKPASLAMLQQASWPLGRCVTRTYHITSEFARPLGYH